MKKAFLSLTVGAALGLASVQASAVVLEDFIVDETSVPGSALGNANLVADKLTGNYNEVITFTGGTFEVKLVWDAGQFVANDGATPVGSLLGSALPAQYGMYGLLTSTGTVNNNIDGSATFNATGATLGWYIDPNSDTVKGIGPTAADAFSIAGNIDDYLIASTSTLISGTGHSFPGSTANGDFQTNFGDLTLTTAGESYFIAPRPFHVNLEATGQFNSFELTGTQFINGSADVTLTSVPEPGVLALMGLGLLGLGATSARRRKA